MSAVWQALSQETGRAVERSGIEQLAHFSPEEQESIFALANKLAEEGRVPTEDELELLREKHKAADIALFGRMLADSPKYNTEAACQVAHAVTVHRAAVEDDFFTAVDDLNTREEEAGSAHMGEQGFGAGLFYLYVCIDRDLLKENLGGDAELAGKAIKAIIEAAATVAPTGKQNSFASRAWPITTAWPRRQPPATLAVAGLHEADARGRHALRRGQGVGNHARAIWTRCITKARWRKAGASTPSPARVPSRSYELGGG